MTTRMIHPVHGATHVYDLGEQKRLESAGWRVEGAESAADMVATIVAVARADAALDDALDENVAPLKRKPGRPKAK